MNDDEDILSGWTVSLGDLIHLHRLNDDLVVFAGDYCRMCEFHDNIGTLDRADLRDAA